MARSQNTNGESVITEQDWLAAVEQARAQPDEIPTGWISMREFSRIIGREDSVAKDRMRGLVIKGLAERRFFRSRVATGGIQRIPFYRLVKQPNA